MEKLQQALQKARQQRAGAQSADGVDAQATTRTGAQGASELWAGLTPFSPDPKELERNRMVAFEASREAVPFDILRTKITLAMRKNGWRRLAITSPTANCGKSTTSCNIALGLSRQSDATGILFEFDLRKPVMSERLGFRVESTIADMLDGKTPFEEHARRYRNNVAVAVASRAFRDPTSVLISTNARETLASIEKRYEPDIMLFDLPPVLASDDTRAFLKEVDCALIVARAEDTTMSQLDSAEREVAEHTNVVGVALNQCRFNDPGLGNYDAQTY